MSNRIVYDLVDPAELVNYVRQFDQEVLRPEAQLSLDQWLPNVTTEDLDFRIRKGALNDVDVAEYRAWDTPAVMTGRPGTTRIKGELGPVSRQIPLSEEEFLRQRSLDRGSNDPIVNAIFDDAERMVRSVQARIELARGDLIDDGKVTINEGGFNLEADWGRDPSMSPTVGTLWSNPAADIIQDLLGYAETYYDQNGTYPGALRVTRQILGYMALNTEVREYAAANGSTPSRVPFAAINEIFASQGLPEFFVYDTSVRVGGVKTSVLDSDKVYYMPPAGEPVGNTFYGPTAEALKLREKGLIERDAVPGIVAVVTESEHPVQTFTVATAIALPVLPNPDLIMDISVL
jgi:hypothetical protein